MSKLKILGFNNELFPKIIKLFGEVIYTISIRIIYPGRSGYFGMFAIKYLSLKTE